MTHSTKTAYGYSKVVPLAFADAVERVTAELQQEGFGILTTIDVQAKVKEKLGRDMAEYVILGACNPALAHQALQIETEIGLLLPCNVIVYRKEEQTFIAVTRPTVAMSMIDNPRLGEIAEKVEEMLRRILDRII